MKTKLSLAIAVVCLGLALPAQAQWHHGGSATISSAGAGTVGGSRSYSRGEYAARGYAGRGAYPYWRGGYPYGGGYRYGYPYWRGGWSWSIGFGFPFYYGYPYYGYPYYGYPYPGYGYYPYSGYGAYYGQGAPYYGSRPLDGSRYGGGSVVARVQQRLASAGYYRGEIDGVMGPRTRSAIRAYERRHGLPVDGAVDRPLLEAMGLG
ncbi:MAG: peptidoglycan-binding protein [Verrucomicrobia bacterium]|nr:peptidoglycan-binding protein [Verrucomicrobiota bacterium]